MLSVWQGYAIVIALTFLGTFEVVSGHKQTCIERFFGPDKLACFCNATFCDSGLRFEWPEEIDEILQISSSKAGERFKQTRFKLELKANETDLKKENYGFQNDESDVTVVKIVVKINEHFQKVTGFGGAITDSAASLIMQLDEKIRDRLLEDYFGKNGLNYNMARLPIGGTDMSARAYTYNDLNIQENPAETDFELKKFALQIEDLEWKIPLVKLINEKLSSLKRMPLKLMTSCWSPPAWMKDNSNLIQGNLKSINNKDKDDQQGLNINPYYATYASYIIKFLEEYRRFNVTFWALSAQNEPRSPARNGLSVIHHNSVNFTPDQLASLYKDHLLPQLSRNLGGIGKGLLHFVWDDVIDEIELYMSKLNGEKSIREQIAGIALHWYSQGLREQPYHLVETAFRKMPQNYAMISTEASYLGGQKPGDWSHGSGYARDLMRSLRTGFIGWLDWNLALDKEGGPTWAQNPLDSAIQIDLESQSYIKNPMYFALGHITRFVPPNSTIVKSNVIVPNGPKDDESYDHLYVLAAELEDTILVYDVNDDDNGSSSPKQLARKISLVLHNTLNRVRKVQIQLVDCKLKRKFDDLFLELPAQSLQSFAFIC